MQHFGRELTYESNSASNTPVGTVRDGETFLIDTELASGNWLHGPDDQWDPSKTCANNPCGVVAVEGAEPGDVVAVRIDEIRPDPFGYMAIGTTDGLYPSTMRRLFGEWLSHTVGISDGRIHLTSDLSVPLRPLIGTLGTTVPVGAVTNLLGGWYGGNLDVQEVTVGATVRLPVAVPGALVNIGDVHARQSDGELSAVEMRSTLALTITVEHPAWPIAGPRIEDATHLSAVALDDDVRAASEMAFEGLLRWLRDAYPVTEQEAYLLLGACGEARATRLLPPGNFTYVWKIAREYLPSPRP